MTTKSKMRIASVSAFERIVSVNDREADPPEIKFSLQMRLRGIRLVKRSPYRSRLRKRSWHTEALSCSLLPIL
jgi:hypothetical protein